MTPIAADRTGRQAWWRQAWWRRVWWRRAGAGVVALAAAFMLVPALVGNPDTAPATPTGVAPANGVALDAPPAEISLAFSRGVAPQQVHLTVGTAGGESVTTGPTRLLGQTALVSVSINSSGDYLVAYHVVLADGEQASGLSRFTVTTSGDGRVGPQPGRAEPAGGTAPGEAGTGPDPAAADGHQHVGDDPLSIVLICLDGLLIVGLLVLLLRRPRVRASADGQDPP